MDGGDDIDGFDEPVGAVMQESQCGATEDFQDVELYNGSLGVSGAFVNRHQAAVGQIQWKSDLAARYASPGNVNGARWCSGTLLPGNLFLTAGHCFNPGEGGWIYPKHGNGTALSAAEIATEMVVNFNYQKDSSGVMRTPQVFSISELVEHNLDGLDYAIVRLNGSPGAVFPQARIAKEDANAGDMLAIIEHPNGLPKKIDAGPLSFLSGTRIHYGDIDTLGGSSGSGILRGSTGMLVGVHTNGGCTSSGGTNSGMRISSLLGASDTLYDLSRLDFMDGIWRSSGGRSTTYAGNPRFRLHLDAADTIEINLESSVDTYVYLLDTAGNVLNYDDDSGDGLNSRLSHDLAAGDYIVVAATYNNAQSSDFQLSSSTGDLSALAQAAWSGSGGANPSSTSNPRFVLNLRHNADVELNLTSSIDTYLFLLDSTGNEIASDDDSGPGLNSWMARSLNAGQYVVVAATYTAGQSGSFDLTSTHGTIRSAPSSFARVTGDGAGSCPLGKFHASRADVSSKRALAESQLNTWDIARLTEGWALRGPGYGYDFKYEVVVLGHTLCATP